MPALSPQALFARLRAALPAGSHIHTPVDETHPLIADVSGVGSVRAYMWTITRDQSAEGRPPDEFKIQLILPGQGRGNRGSLDLAPPHQTVLLGYSPDFGVFVGWDARYYADFGYSRNVQVREGLLAEGRDSGWAVAPPRRVSGGQEVRVAFSPSNLRTFLLAARAADAGNLAGHAREALFIFRTPSARLPDVPANADALEQYVARQRQRLAATRLSRDSAFSPAVKEEYGHSCAICGNQLEVVESAHIIEVREEGSTDAIWNGIALCASHHKLFDAHVLVIRPTLEIVVNDTTVQHLRDRGRARGIEQMVLAFRGRRITAPSFFATNTIMKASMEEALRTRQERTGIA